MSERRSGGLGLVGVIVVVLVVLKVVEVEPVAGWSWWWVFAPFAPAGGGFLIWGVWSFVAMLRRDVRGWWRTRRAIRREDT